MTLIGLVVSIIMFGVALVVANILDLLPFYLAVVVASLIAIGIILIVLLLKRRALPVCKNGTCNVTDYEGIPVANSSDKGLRFKCKCGDVYRWENNRYYLIEQDGHEVLYKVRKCIGFPWSDSKE